jgi:hypothetical protein
VHWSLVEKPFNRTPNTSNASKIYPHGRDDLKCIRLRFLNKMSPQKLLNLIESWTHHSSLKHLCVGEIGSSPKVVWSTTMMLKTWYFPKWTASYTEIN